MNFLCEISHFPESPVQACKATGDYKASVCFYLVNVEMDLNNQCKSKLVLLWKVLHASALPFYSAYGKFILYILKNAMALPLQGQNGEKQGMSSCWGSTVISQFSFALIETGAVWLGSSVLDLFCMGHNFSNLL